MKNIDNRKMVHGVILKLLMALKKICTVHDIPFWLEYGTLLGAIRHKGFIPWDNEADVGIFREDFDRLKKIVEAELPGHIFFQTKETDPAYESASLYIEAKLRDKYSRYKDFENRYPKHKWHNGIQVDIFIYDPVILDGVPCYINAFEKTFTRCKSYFLLEEIEFLKEIQFEGEEFFIPIGYDKYLERNYGDYMKLPPESERIFEPAEIDLP
ncbi:LicD family protein [Pedobacter endophyticus]|uniref:LicD family protein n=1 Tax=Pedobacter endophyticus TaxID=2789740 RepID=A0A7S9KY36_9SPHI|nr:LicD family protein [Pedobacter endophyticus]QPH38949.1 LicD family protein [Pedobacter endophyticus]